MVNINGKEWAALEPTDIQTFLSEQDFQESFYFEFKDDRTKSNKLAKEISAFANTFGGYVLLGVSDDKQIEGCVEWNEQRIHTTIHDSVTPTPSFDVKRFTCDEKIVYVIRIDEGAELPYITSSGKIYERLSSGSFVVNDSVRLSQIYNKREQLLTKMEHKISIPPITEKVSNVYGIIDIGFALVLSETQSAFNIFDKIDLIETAKKIEHKSSQFNLSRIGNSIVYVPGGLSTKKGSIPAHTNNFLEIMADGSAKMRVLLHNNEQENSNVNMVYANTLICSFKDVYTCIMGNLFPNNMVYAKKYESLTVYKQFHPTFFYDEDILKLHPDWQEDNERIFAAKSVRQAEVGIDTVVTDNRIPKTGLYTIDKRQMEKWGVDYTAESIIDELFYSSFETMGIIPTLEESTDEET